MCSQALKIKLRRADGRTNKNKRSYRDHPLRRDLKIKLPFYEISKF
jgi:hypothetical protein